MNNNIPTRLFSLWLTRVENDTKIEKKTKPNSKLISFLSRCRLGEYSSQNVINLILRIRSDSRKKSIIKKYSHFLRFFSSLRLSIEKDIHLRYMRKMDLERTIFFSQWYLSLKKVRKWIEGLATLFLVRCLRERDLRSEIGLKFFSQWVS